MTSPDAFLWTVFRYCLFLDVDGSALDIRDVFAKDLGSI